MDLVTKSKSAPLPTLRSRPQSTIHQLASMAEKTSNYMVMHATIQLPTRIAEIVESKETESMILYEGAQ